MKFKKYQLFSYYLSQIFRVGMLIFSLPFSLSASNVNAEPDTSQASIKGASVYHTSLKGGNLVIENKDISGSLNQSYYVPWKSRVLFPVVVQAKKDIIFGERKLSAGKHITIAYHLQNYKSLADCKGDQKIPLSEEFEGIAEQTMVIDLIKRLNPSADISTATEMEKLLEILTKIKLEKNWVGTHFKPMDESEKNKIS